jgi:hypothetical protein
MNPDPLLQKLCLDVFDVDFRRRDPLADGDGGADARPLPVNAMVRQTLNG